MIRTETTKDVAKTDKYIEIEDEESKLDCEWAETTEPPTQNIVITS